MRWDKRIHECLKVGPPPLSESIANLPFIINTLTGKLAADRSKAFVQTRLKPLQLALVVMEVIAGPNNRALPISNKSGNGN